MAQSFVDYVCRDNVTYAYDRCSHNFHFIASVFVFIITHGKYAVKDLLLLRTIQKQVIRTYISLLEDTCARRNEETETIFVEREN